MCCYSGAAYKELLRDWHVLCAFLGCLLPHFQHGLPHCGKGFGDTASLASAAPVHTCSRSESADSTSICVSHVKVICNLQGCSASQTMFTVAIDSVLERHRDELACIRLRHHKTAKMWLVIKIGLQQPACCLALALLYS